MAFVYVHELAGVADEIAEEKYETLSNYNAVEVKKTFQTSFKTA